MNPANSEKTSVALGSVFASAALTLMKLVVGLITEADIAEFEVMLHDPRPETKPHLYVVK